MNSVQHLFFYNFHHLIFASTFAQFHCFFFFQTLFFFFRNTQCILLLYTCTYIHTYCTHTPTPTYIYTHLQIPTYIQTLHIVVCVYTSAHSAQNGEKSSWALNKVPEIKLNEKRLRWENHFVWPYLWNFSLQSLREKVNVFHFKNIFYLFNRCFLSPIRFNSRTGPEYVIVISHGVATLSPAVTRFRFAILKWFIFRVNEKSNVILPGIFPPKRGPWRAIVCLLSPIWS